MLKRSYSILFFAISSLVLLSCNDDDPVELTEEQKQNESINQWIYSVMDEVYFWTDQLPANPDYLQSPEDFFDEIKYSEDRFSIITPNFDALLASLDGEEIGAGYEFVLLRSGPDEIVALVTYVKPNTDAQAKGLKRGDVIEQINGKSMTLSNYESVITDVFNNHTISYLRYATNGFAQQPDINLTVSVIDENPIFLDSIYAIDNSKIGYLVYNFFSNGGANNYNDALRSKIGEIKTQGITDMILDLRYNGGGSTNSATILASLLAPNVTSSNIFYRNQWNALYQDYWSSQPDGEAQLVTHFYDEANNIGNDIGGNLYVLTGFSTASASELIINGLDPYMNVTIIGDTTVGKNVGSFPVEDTENDSHNYGLLPIVIKLTNVDGYSGYDKGFAPLGDNLINEFQFPMAPLGDLNDPLLSRAVELITGKSIGGRKSGRESFARVEILGSSIERHPRNGKAIIDIPQRK